MPSISYDSFVPWANYHLTSGTRTPPALEPRVEVEDMGRFHSADVADVLGIERFAATLAQLWHHIGRVWHLHARKKLLGELGNPPMPFPAALVGRGWSFSGIIGADSGKRRESMLMCEGLAGSIMLTDTDLVQRGQAGRIAMTAGGTRFRELLAWAARHGKSVETSGTHLGATVAGAIATATHGSRLGFGGMQNMIAGLHFATGLGESVWIERTSEPVLTDEAAARLHPPGAPPVQIIRDDELFDDVLVHLGCMGIVNCAAIRLIDDVRYEVLRRDRPVDDQWLARVADGKWEEIAAWLGVARKPIFYEVTLDPHAWNGKSALHTLYFEADAPPSEAGGVPGQGFATPLLAVGDAVVRFGEDFSLAESASINIDKLGQLADLETAGWTGENGEEEGIDERFGPLPADMRVFDPRSTAQSAYDYYRLTGGFGPNDPLSPPATWRQLHGDEITGGYPGSLYNASYAIERDTIGLALPLIVNAVSGVPRSFVFTLRFVSGPRGAMAFTRFDENCVIEIDGLSPWICRRTRSRLQPGSPTYARDKKMLDYLELALPRGARAIQRAFNGKLGYSSHFGKRSFLDRGKIGRDFKDRITRFRAARDRLLPSNLGKAIFWNWGAVNFGIIDRPAILPPDPPT